MLQLDETSTQLLTLPDGHMEVFVDVPSTSARLGLAIIAHPQPLLGGSAKHKLPQFLAHSLRDAGWTSIRPNFRGVGNSTGSHDQGHGEALDLRVLHAAAKALADQQPVALIGVSFGAYVQAQLAAYLQAQGTPADKVILAAMPSGTVSVGRHYDTPDAITAPLVVHGERDDSVPLANILDWARPRAHPVVVLPGSDHLFAGKLPLLRSLVLQHLQAAN
ncbi:alpha/beta fold hydrolase [Lampropedia aestuarii]|uniref:Alpha/beta fold hydrolase n=1 Tax=Lampropedia aestuarii TaxID=2562762 RepID=A0A4S5BPY8_9BURK|nr:alpha/beta fold hydrolase [Lampropedia aestuarii]THJ34520.1 alpha/beta fold hydrolase [Lampropedia aestuarii]